MTREIKTINGKQYAYEDPHVIVGECLPDGSDHIGHERPYQFQMTDLIYPMPLKSVKSWVEKTYLAKIVTEISPRYLRDQRRLQTYLG